ncbi:MAG: molybdopterin-synthase adenylyltransferase MoeB [Fluviicola sp.]
MNLSSAEIKRYARHLSLENVGMEGQKRLKTAKVLVVGAGGLGAPVLQYLVAAGVGTIGIIDFDVVDESNLQRQVLFTVQDIGKSKVLVAVDRLKQLNPRVTLIPYNLALDVENAKDILKGFDIIVDGTDNFSTRYLVNDTCVLLNKPFVHGSIFKFQGQVSVFNYQNGPSYRCLYPIPPSAKEAPNCSEVGVLGVLPGVVGTRMANECLKMILNIGTVLNGTVEVIDLLKNEHLHLKVQRNESNFQRTELDDSYDVACNNSAKLDATITVNELKSHLQKRSNLFLVDVREPFELEICSLEGALNIPLGQIPSRVDEIPKNKPVVVICHHGVRSANAIAFLKEHGFDNLSNLQGGVHAWALEIDSKMTKY